MTGILNYGVGNILAFERIFKQLDSKILIVNSGEDLDKCDRVILPGVGHFDVAMKRLNNSGLRDPLDKFILTENKPLLGICVGMQMLGYSSDEGEMKGLGYILGETKKIDIKNLQNKPYLPHMGWNNIHFNKNDIILNEIENDENFYFLHSYHFVPKNHSDLICFSIYGEKLSAIVSNNKVYGIQFHPEKSHSQGIQILRNFSKIY